MDTILIFVVLPIATIIFSIALQKILKCPTLVAAVVFAIFLILTYTVFGTDFIIFAILFAILAFGTAFLVSLFCRIIRRLRNLEDDDSDCDCNNHSYGGSTLGRGRSRNRRNNGCSCGCNCNNSGNDNENLLTISSRCGNGENTDLLTISTGGTCGNNNSNNCGCDSNNNNETIVVNAEIAPTNNGRSGCFRGAFRRRC